MAGPAWPCAEGPARQAGLMGTEGYSRCPELTRPRGNPQPMGLIVEKNPIMYPRVIFGSPRGQRGSAVEWTSYTPYKCQKLRGRFHFTAQNDSRATGLNYVHEYGRPAVTRFSLPQRGMVCMVGVIERSRREATCARQAPNGRLFVVPGERRNDTWVPCCVSSSQEASSNAGLYFLWS